MIIVFTGRLQQSAEEANVFELSGCKHNNMDFYLS